MDVEAHSKVREEGKGFTTAFPPQDTALGMATKALGELGLGPGSISLHYIYIGSLWIWCHFHITYCYSFSKLSFVNDSHFGKGRFTLENSG